MGARYYAPSLGRWISEDAYRGDISDPLSLNLYVFCINNPLIYVDPSGYEYVILWSYGLSEVEAYIRDDGTIDWQSFERKSSFSRAAQTRRDELIAEGVSEDYIILKRIDSVEDLKNTWHDLLELDKVEGLNIYSHGWTGGPEVAGGGTRSFWNEAGILNWTEDAYVVFHGCNTAQFARHFAKEQTVISYGQKGYSSFSLHPTFHIPITFRPASTRIYLFDFDLLNLLNLTGWGDRYEPN